MQLDMFAVLEPEPPRPVWTPEPERLVMTRAYGEAYEMSVREGQFDPFELEVRGIGCVITQGFCTHTIDGPGAAFWSETGFRSFGLATDDPDQIRAAIEAYIDGPTTHGAGCGGKLTKWWPCWVLQWCQSRSFELGRSRETVWAQWGPEKHKECWDNHDVKQLAALQQMQAENIDPDEVIASVRPKDPAVTMMELQTGRAA